MTAQAKHEALKRGADNLMNELEWALRDRPRALANSRREYKELCFRMYGKIEKDARGKR